MISITGALVAEHRMFCEVFDQIGTSLPTAESVVEIKRVTRLVEGLLLNHAKTEDDLMSLLAHHGRPDKGSYSRLQKEHQEVDARLRRVYLTDKADLARSLLTAAMAASRRHFDREERLVFPMLEKVLDPEMLSKLGTMWFLRKHAPANWAV
jgi:hemerythrin-like domain-containing protein